MNGLGEDVEHEEDSNRDFRIVKSHSAQLCEHFDTVQIFVTKKGDDGTMNCDFGEGNWFARYGQVKMWANSHERGERD